MPDNTRDDNIEGEAGKHDGNLDSPVPDSPVPDSRIDHAIFDTSALVQLKTIVIIRTVTRITPFVRPIITRTATRNTGTFSHAPAIP